MIRAGMFLEWFMTSVGCVWYVASYYGIIILNFTFFYVALVRYVIVPVSAVMSNNILRAICGFLRVFCYAPYVQFFVYYLFCSVYLITDMIPTFIEMLLTGKVIRSLNVCLLRGVNLRGSNQRQNNNTETQNEGEEPRGNGDHIPLCGVLALFCWVWIMMFLMTCTFVAVGVLSWFGIRQYFMVLLGCLFYIPFVIEMVYVLICVYHNWWLTVTCHRGTRSMNGCSRRARTKLNRIRNRRKKMMEVQIGGLSHDIGKLKKTEAHEEDVIAGRATDTSSGALETAENTDRTNSDGIALTTVNEMRDGGTPDEDEPLDPESSHNERRRAGWAKLKGMFAAMVFPGKYVHISDLSDALYDVYREKKVNRTSLWIAILLNLFLLGVDIYDCRQNLNSYFCASIAFRILFLPAASYFHQGIVFMSPKRWKEAAGAGLRRVIYVSAIFSAVLILGFIAVLIYVKQFMSLSSIPDGNLSWPTGKIPQTNFTHGDLFPTLCAMTYDGHSLIDIVGTSFGVYEKFQNPALFNIINEHLYPGWDYNKSTRGIEIDVFGEKIPIVLFRFDNLTVWAFRGFASGPELAIILELFCSQHIVPFFQSFILFKEYMEAWFLDWIIPYAYKFGQFWLSTETALDVMVRQSLGVYYGYRLMTENLVFTGVNSGGVVAKIMGMSTGKTAFAFMSFNIFTDLLQYMNLNEELSLVIVNLFHRDGWFSVQEPGLANNIVLPSIIDTVFKDDKRPTFCTMALSCKNHLQYEEFCRQLMGDEFVDDVNEYLKESRYWHLF